MSLNEIGSMVAMQGFSGLSLFTVLLLMALGLAIIFGQMGVINMAHGEFMGHRGLRRVPVLATHPEYAPGLREVYFVPAVVAAFFVAAAVGYVVEVLLIRRLYKRPLDTLLATWGLSLAMQQFFRSFINPKEVSAELPEWLLGAFNPTPSIQVPRNGIFVMGLTILVTVGVYMLMLKSRWGGAHPGHHAKPHHELGGRHQHRSCRPLHVRSRCGIAGLAGAAFTTIGSTGPTSGSLYIVDTFLVVVFGGAANLIGTIRLGVLDRSGAVAARVLPHQRDGQGADAAHDHHHPDDPPARAVHHQGPHLTFGRNHEPSNQETEQDRPDRGGRAFRNHPRALPGVLQHLPLESDRKYLTYAFVGVSLVLLWGNGGILSLGQGVFFGLGGYCMAMS